VGAAYTGAPGAPGAGETSVRELAASHGTGVLTIREAHSRPVRMASSWNPYPSHAPANHSPPAPCDLPESSSLPALAEAGVNWGWFLRGGGGGEWGGGGGGGVAVTCCSARGAGDRRTEA
jgi:hypothetical protein